MRRPLAQRRMSKRGEAMPRPYEEEETFAKGGFETRAEGDALLRRCEGGSASVGARHASPS
jgi:hypothetical protein